MAEGLIQNHMETRQLYEAVPVTEHPTDSGRYITNKGVLYFDLAKGSALKPGWNYWNPDFWLRPLPPQEDNTLAFAEWASGEGWEYQPEKKEWRKDVSGGVWDMSSTSLFAIFTEHNKG